MLTSQDIIVFRKNRGKETVHKFGRNEEDSPSSIQTLYFRAPSNPLAASTLTQQRWHRVVMEEKNLHVSRFTILASSRDCPRSVNDTDHEREQIQNIVAKGTGTFSP